MKRVALVVGINEYEDRQIKTLKCAEDDALEMCVALKGLGYDPVERLTGKVASRRILREARELTQGLEPGDLFLFFFAGHGVAPQGRNLLLGHDAELGYIEEGESVGTAPMRLLKRNTEGVVGLNRAFMIDACRDNVHEGKRGAVEGLQGAEGYRTIFARERGVEARGSCALLCSCDEGQQAQEIEAIGHGVFTLALLEMFEESRREGKELRLADELQDRLRERMSSIARRHNYAGDQNPWVQRGGSGEAPVLVEGRPAEPESPGAVRAEAPTRVVTPHPLPEVVWFAATGGGAHAEVPEADIADRVAGGEITRETRVWKDGMAGWQAAGEVAELAALFPAPLPEPPPPPPEPPKPPPAQAEERERTKKASIILPEGWTFEERRVVCPTPEGDVEKDISYYRNPLGMEFVLIPAGEFMMGSPEYEGWREVREGPVHKVRITEPFLLQAHQVTVGQFTEFARTTGYRTEAERGDGALGWTGTEWKKDKGRNWRNPGFEQSESHPVTCVSWNDAQTFCRWLSDKGEGTFRLPTEAQWEYACRAGSRYRYWWGGEEADGGRCANVADKTAKGQFPDWTVMDTDDGYVFTAPVGNYLPNPFGLYDMTGNVWEWCSDWFGEDYYSKSPDADPPGPPSGELRVCRGGSWYGSPRYCRSACRGRYTPGIRDNLLGFRVSRVAPRP